MNLTELYARTPVGEHKNILVARDRVFVRSAEGLEEYILYPSGELVLVRSDKTEALVAIRQDLVLLGKDLAQIKAKLGA